MPATLIRNIALSKQFYTTYKIFIMKKTKAINILTLAILLFTSINLNAQKKDSKPRPCIIQTLYINQKMDMSEASMDSLLNLYKTKIVNLNPYYVSSKILRHWWGHDSRQVIFVFELKSWDDITKASEKTQEIMKAHVGWTDEGMKSFIKKMEEMFGDSFHSDEIYRIIGD